MQEMLPNLFKIFKRYLTSNQPPNINALNFKCHKIFYFFSQKRMLLKINILSDLMLSFMEIFSLSIPARMLFHLIISNLNDNEDCEEIKINIHTINTYKNLLTCSILTPLEKKMSCDVGRFIIL